MPGYFGTPLVKKLGIKPGSTLALVRAPEGFDRELVGLPDDVRVLVRGTSPADLGIWFVRARRELDGQIDAIGRRLGAALWIAWPKKASGVKTDVTEDVVRNAALAHGLVDYKVCAITDVWSGLKFARRKGQ